MTSAVFLDGEYLESVSLCIAEPGFDTLGKLTVCYAGLFRVVDVQDVYTPG